ncbi:transcription intermediary factor 1-beta isoform X2 [Taeniopygia guttata]|uniref:transcription intermediary factor 1-beta isoform X2 n=1 Tax=Taeniopygia guttata TaxID=59729 RepID=UPI003BB8D3CC
MSEPEAAAPGGGPGAKGAALPEPPGPLELCGACRERLSPRREPRLLPCLHSVCRGCLGTAPGGDAQAPECPVCHQPCPLGDIMENFFLQDSGVGTAPASKQSCTSCEDNAAATSFCLECAEPLCDTCVEAHQRVRYTREHSVQPLGSPAVPVPVPAAASPFPGPCPAHPSQPLSLFCSACDRLTCAECHRGPHRAHPSQPLDEAIRQQRSVLVALLQRLADKHAAVQRCAKELRAFMRGLSEAQQRLQVEVKLAVLQVMRELNKRSKALVCDVQRAAEGRQERLQRQQRALSRAQRQQEHVLRFGARALDSPHGAALLLSRRLIHSQLLRALGVPLEPLEPQGEMRFQWDPQGWTRSAQSFGAIISEPPLPPSLSPPPAGRPSPTAQGPPTLSPPPQLSPPRLEPAATESPETAPSPGNGVTGGRTRNPGSSPREEKFVKTLLIKRRGPPGAQDSPRLPKEPRVSLERLELDLELDPAQPPVFRIFPGPSEQEFSLIVIEQGTAGTEGTEGTEGTPGAAGTAGTEGTAGTVQPHGVLLVKEEQQESPIGDIGDIGDIKPVGLLPPPPGDPGPAAGSPPCPGVPGVPGVSCCRVCGQAGAVVMCDRCQRCFHLHCHLPALQDVPSPEWTCLLCQELPPPLPEPQLDTEPGPPLKLSPQDQQRCEFVLLELLCHEPCRPLQRLCSSPDGRDAMDLTLMRARLQEKLSPHYRSPEEFARDGWRLLRQFHRLTEDKADVQSILGLQRFLESRLSAAFGDQKFSRLLLDPEEALEVPPGS